MTAESKLTREAALKIESDERCYQMALQVEFKACLLPTDKMPKNLTMKQRVERRVQPVLAHCRQIQHAMHPQPLLVEIINRMLAAAEVEPLKDDENEGDRGMGIINLRIVRYLYMEAQARKAAGDHTDDYTIRSG